MKEWRRIISGMSDEHLVKFEKEVAGIVKMLERNGGLGETNFAECLNFARQMLSERSGCDEVRNLPELNHFLGAFGIKEVS